jgi:hypothetical protein
MQNLYAKTFLTIPIIAAFCLTLCANAKSKNSVMIESVMVSCLSKQTTVNFLASLDSNPDWTECPEWVILLNVNDTIHSKSSLCACNCQEMHAAAPVESHPDDNWAKSCSFRVKLNLKYQTRLRLQLESKNETNPSNHIFVQMECMEDALESNSRFLLPENETGSPSIVWSANPSGWISSYLSLYHSLVRSAMMLNLPPPPGGQPPPSASSEPPNFDLPVFVMNLPHRRDRRRSTEALLHSMGFARVVFPNATLASAIDPDALVALGRVRRAAIDAILARKDKGPPALRSYLANALDQVAMAGAGARLHRRICWRRSHAPQRRDSAA